MRQYTHKDYKCELDSVLKRRGETITGFARKIGVDVQTVRRWLTGSVQIGVDDVRKMCDVLQIEAREVVEPVRFTLRAK